MKSLKELFESEIRTSMMALACGISISIVLILGFIQIRHLQADFRLAENFITETTNNSLALDQPIMVHRSILEFWRAFATIDRTIRGLEVSIDQTLVSQVGQSLSSATSLDIRLPRCLPGLQRNICITYLLDPFPFLEEISSLLLTVALSAIATYFVRKKIAERNVRRLALPLELEIKRISKISESFENSRADETISSRHIIPIKEVGQLSQAYKDLWTHSQRFSEIETSMKVAQRFNLIARQVSHDIRSPVSALNMAVTALNATGAEEVTSVIRSATKRINDIANDLLAKSKLHSGTHATQATSTHLVQRQNQSLADAIAIAPLLESVLNEKRVQYAKIMNIEFIGKNISAADLTVRIDPIELARVVSNIMNNAVEAITSKGIITLSLHNNTESVEIQINDNGRGLPPEILARLGEPGVTFGKSDTDSGSGLGLYHARQTIESAGGQLTIRSLRGEGTTVTIRLPKTDVSNHQTP